jgi:oxygen-independent coproporphyrinogen-3 oxidase
MVKRMLLSLYIHIPYCTRKCAYCDFASEPQADQSLSDYVTALLADMARRRQVIAGEVTATTLYIGGGTPSLLAPADVDRIITLARQLYNLTNDAEVTLEANPGTVDMERLDAYRAAGVNRLSLGIQSLDDRYLKLLGRIHSSDEARQAVAAARAAGFTNLSIDFIHSLPGESLEHWHETLAEAVSLKPEHISAYGLTLEEGTPLSDEVASGRLELPSEETQRGMFEATIDLLAAAGYRQYELSNFSLPDRESRHNRNYWRRGSYLGFGAGAHSFLTTAPFGARWSAPSPPALYLNAIADGRLPEEEKYVLSRTEAMAETLFLGLRQTKGVCLADFERTFGQSLVEVYGENLPRLTDTGLLLVQEGYLRLARQAQVISNQILCRFI